MASAEHGDGKKVRILLIPFFASSHIGPFTDLAVRLAAANPDVVEPTVGVTPANVAVVRAALEQRHDASSAVKIATYRFPDVAGLPPGVENLTAAAASSDAWRIDAAALDEALTRPAQEALIRELSPDAVVTDFHFFWNSIVAGELGVPCVKFSVIGPFSSLAMRHLEGTVVDDGEVVVPGFPGPEIRIPRTELPEFLLKMKQEQLCVVSACRAAEGRSFGCVFNAVLDMERQYCELYTLHVNRRTYFVGPVSLPLPPAGAGAGAVCESGSSSSCSIFAWLGSMPTCSVLYVCFGTYASISNHQLRELALGLEAGPALGRGRVCGRPGPPKPRGPIPGPPKSQDRPWLEASGKPFLWVLRADKDGWEPPAGWEERVGRRATLVRGWAPQTAILAHPSVGEFIEERLVTEVLKIGERVWSGTRSTRYEDKVTVPAEAVARAVARFLEPGGTGEAARVRARRLAAKAHAAVSEGGSSHTDLRRLINDLIQAKEAAGS